MQHQTSSISNFSRFALHILLPLILIVSAAGIAFSYFFEQKVIFNSELCGAYKVHRIITETHHEEIPIFGSSRAEGSYIPDSLGTNVFNYGLAGTKYDVALFFLEEECLKKKQEQRIIINLDLDGIKANLGDIANYVPSAQHPRTRALLDSAYQLHFALPFLKYYGLFDTYLRSYYSNKLQLTKISNHGAALEKNKLTEAAFAQLVEQRKKSTDEFTHDTMLEKRLFTIINKHPERTFLFVIAPYHSSYFHHSANSNEANAFISKLESNTNVRVFNFSTLPIPDSGFLNTTHVNYIGAKIFNHVLKDSLLHTHP